MSEVVIVAIITTLGSVIVALIQTNSKDREQKEAREDRELSERTIESLKEEVQVLLERVGTSLPPDSSLSSLSLSSSTGGLVPTATEWTGSGGEPASSATTPPPAPASTPSPITDTQE